ncbi:MAG TPA: IS4 family transposase [Thermomicrobiales bacterium]|jgi:hypothetical protein
MPRSPTIPARCMLLFCVLMNLYADEALPHVLRRVVGYGSVGDAAGATAGARCQARYRLGARPVVALFRRLCRPLATPATSGAFLFGRRLLALDGSHVDLPDTPANARAFGRRPTPRGRGAWPQALVVRLVACGTRAVCDAGVWPGLTDERRAGRRLLRSAGPGTLVLWGRGFQHVAMVEAVQQRGADFLGRLPATVRPVPVQALADGTLLVRLRPFDHPRRYHGAHVVVRLIRSTLDDPQRPGHRLEHRLVTALVAPHSAPARELVAAYHRRWAVESALDELKAHQRPARPLRSRKPLGVVREIYGLLVAHYLLRAAMVQAAPAALAPLRLSFVGTLRLIRDLLPLAQLWGTRARRALYRRALRAIAGQVLPQRAERSNPRVVKQKMANFRVKTAQHQRWPQPTKSFADAIVLLIYPTFARNDGMGLGVAVIVMAHMPARAYAGGSAT